MAQLQFGDLVRVYIEGHGSPASNSYVIGLPDYSKGLGDVVLVGTEQAHGMPVNACWCTPLGERDVQLAERLLDRYLRLYARARRPPSPPEGDQTGEG